MRGTAWVAPVVLGLATVALGLAPGSAAASSSPRAISTTRHTGGGSAPHIIFLNACPGGLTVSPGETDDARTDTSSTLTRPITLSPFPHGDESWASIVEQTASFFAPFRIEVTDVDPSPAPHDEVVICGTAAEADAAPGTVGFAAWSCTPIANAMTFVLAGTIGDFPRYTAETVAQEAAHAWGLDHSFDCRDPMTYLDRCGPKRFLDEPVPCGEYEARACACGGDTQNTYQRIAELFGEANNGPADDTGGDSDGGSETDDAGDDLGEGESDGGSGGSDESTQNGDDDGDGDGGCRVANSAPQPRPSGLAFGALLVLATSLRRRSRNRA